MYIFKVELIIYLLINYAYIHCKGNIFITRLFCSVNSNQGLVEKVRLTYIFNL